VGADVSKLGECEFFLISEMNCQLIVHHPYRTLLQLQKPLNIADDELSLAWSIINDHYLTDLPLLYPLHVITVTAVFMSLVLKPSQTGGLHAAVDSVAALAQGLQTSRSTGGASAPEDASGQQNKVQYLIKWVAEGEVDIKAMVECTQDIISLYEIWEQYEEKSCKEQISRFVKARNLDR
jgi:cyclin-C